MQLAGLVLEPLPTGAWAFLTATTVVATKTLTFAQCFSAFCNDVIWLIVVSFFFAKVLQPSGSDSCRSCTFHLATVALDHCCTWPHTACQHDPEARALPCDTGL